MKHKTHRIVSKNLFLVKMIIMYYLHRFNINLEVCLYTILTIKLISYFSTLPDFIEGNERKKHRTWAHSLYIFTLFIFLLKIIKYILNSLSAQQSFAIVSNIEFIFNIIFTSIFIGWGSHLILDFFSDNGIPLLYPIIKERMQMYKFCTYINDSNEHILATIMYYLYYIIISIITIVLIKDLIIY